LKRKIFLYVFAIIVIICLMSLLAFCQPAIQQDIKQFNGFTGILVQDLSTQEVLFSHNHNRLFTPASLVKLFTLLVGLEILGQEYCYPTVVYFSSAVPGEIKGNLFIKGSGDPTQSPEVIRQIANDLVKKYGIHKIDGDIVLDNSLFLPEEFLGRGWMWDDQNPLIGALMVKGYNVREKQLPYYNTMPLIWGQLFCQELYEQGVQFEGDIRVGVLEEEFTVKAIYYSDTIDQILSYMMKMSDNQSAEIVFRTLPLFENPDEVLTINLAITSLSEVIKEILGIQWGEDYIIVDGCGLSEYNLLTPEQIVMAISNIYKQYGSELLEYLACTDEKGTIRGRFSFQLWGKSGSLPSASGLAGILQTKKNRQVVFSLMENNFLGEENDPKDFENAIIEYIYENY
jgi:serine-type D-Ala-D-Ala carboxypeptidase/endopeptidase (penicillin-binding protein 4)